MRKLFIAITALLIVVSCSQQKHDQNIEQKIERIEKCLIEFKLPAGMLQPDSTQLANPKMLIDRMEYYKVPGVSIAVINNNRIEWSKAYGTMDKNTGVRAAPYRDTRAGAPYDGDLYAVLEAVWRGGRHRAGS